MEDNREVLRFPQIDYDKGKIGKVLNYKEKALIQYFDLDKRFLATKKFDAVAGSSSLDSYDWLFWIKSK